jgi:hypothetical protein
VKSADKEIVKKKLKGKDWNLFWDHLQ